jgi:sulfatase maturation enzyme AslB (radical SAM superfamily)
MRFDRIDLGKYVVISAWFGCNNDCTICMLSGMKSDLPAIGFDRFKKVIAEIVQGRRFENLILSGAEVTTCADLGRYVRFAASFGWFKKIQIQTNGRRLSEKRYVEELIDCGVNEFFVSIHGLEEIHDATTQIPGSFKETVAGLRNLADYQANVISNTVLTRRSSAGIRDLFDFLAGERLSEIHLWNFFPMAPRDSRGQVVSLRELADMLPSLAATAGSAGKHLVLKGFPECLPVPPSAVFDNVFPVTILPDRFWMEFGACGFGACVHRQACSAKGCWGLSSAYVEAYGDERDRLAPMG